MNIYIRTIKFKMLNLEKIFDIYMTDKRSVSLLRKEILTIQKDENIDRENFQKAEFTEKWKWTFWKHTYFYSQKWKCQLKWHCNHFTQITWAKIPKFDKTHCWQACGETILFICFEWSCNMLQFPRRGIWKYLTKLHLHLDLAIPHLGI